MKKLFLSICCFISISYTYAQVNKLVTCSAGNLSSILSNDEKNTVTYLSIDGEIDARDFKIMRDSMPLLSDVIISNVTINSYTGINGTASDDVITYPAQTIPEKAFYNKATLRSIDFTGVAAIGSYAFAECSGLRDIVVLNTSVIDLTNSENVFFNIPSIINLYVDCKLINEKAYNNANQWSRFMLYQMYGDCMDPTNFTLNSTSVSNILQPGEIATLTSSQVQANVSDFGFIWYRDSIYSTNHIVAGPITNVKNSSYTVSYAKAGTYYLVVYDKGRPECRMCHKKASQTIQQAPGTAQLSIPLSTIEFNETTNAQSIDITSNTEWTINSDESWVTFSPLQPTIGNGALTINTLQNTSIDTRTATLTITGNGLAPQLITINQAGTDTLITLTKTELLFTDATNSDTIIITSNSPWTATSSDSWLLISPLSGIGNDTIIVSVEPNTSIEGRTATITINADVNAIIKDEYFQTITVTQSGKVETNIKKDILDDILIKRISDSQKIEVQVATSGEIEIYTGNGKRIVSKEISGNNLFISNVLPKGIYFVKVSTKMNSKTATIIID